MLPSDGYPVPDRERRVEEVIRRSRFITTITRATSVEEARSFVDRIRSEFPGATHHCWAFAAGPPGDTARVGSSDDGEPSGTAGRPMLQVLLHGGVGEIVAVVTRFYGGTKLGTGGLARAYAGGVKLALQGLPTRMRVERVPVVVEVSYGDVAALKRLVEAFDVVVEDESYLDTVSFRCAVPEGRRAQFERELADATRGSGAVRPV